ncbi:sperm-specific antigen 2 isoform X3 [Cynoglossus semilaevis]|uniref:sperm-specific antigen 2 isoform X3 n=1 Tax=Cynoglossus semilaevis TaxID=244447 RepID=UPI000D623C20|nr:sperm-specific antigen 2 isoform X3 [Cynoglossus semilaevis]
MDSSSSTVRRRAWINSSRQWPTLEESEEPLCQLPSASIADDDVFSDGNLTGKIENWLLGCGSEATSRKPGHLSLELSPQTSNCDDDISLGADAAVCNDGETPSKAGSCALLSCLKQRHTKSSSHSGPYLQSLNLNLSMASSCNSSSTLKTTSSVSEVLQMCAEDAENTLYELGFGFDEPQVPVRIPARFFTFPSQAEGINFRLFLDSQLRRIREEDPRLSLASRFRQVQVLTETANAFYGLYSHVSRTPLQRLETPEFTFSSTLEKLECYRHHIRSEPRSPVERLKDTVSKMCLYTGSPRGSDSTSPQTSPKKRPSLPDIPETVLEKPASGRAKKLNLEDHIDGNAGVVANDAKFPGRAEEEVDTHTLQQGPKELNSNGLGVGEEINIRLTDAHNAKTSEDSSWVSVETVIQTDQCVFSPQSQQQECHAEGAEIKPVSLVAYDRICSQIAESVRQVPFCSQRNAASCARAKETWVQVPLCEPEDDTCTVTSSLPVLALNGSLTNYGSSVNSWEEENSSPLISNTPDSTHTPSFPPVQTCEESIDKGKTWCLNPPPPQGLGLICSSLQQVNSFELEEVHSTEEEDLDQSNTTKATTSLLTSTPQPKVEVIRGDSVQSDSSGYADEDGSLLSDRSGR